MKQKWSESSAVTFSTADTSEKEMEAQNYLQTTVGLFTSSK